MPARSKSKRPRAAFTVSSTCTWRMTGRSLNLSSNAAHPPICTGRCSYVGFLLASAGRAELRAPSTVEKPTTATRLMMRMSLLESAGPTATATRLCLWSAERQLSTPWVDVWLPPRSVHLDRPSPQQDRGAIDPLDPAADRAARIRLNQVSDLELLHVIAAVILC